MKRVLIIGAGSAGKMVASEILNKRDISLKFSVAGFLDDNNELTSCMGLPVFGPLSCAKDTIKSQGIDEVIIAIPSAGKDVIQKIFLELSGTEAAVKIVPGIFEIIEGKVSYSQIRSIQPSDLLGREEVGFDLDRISPFYEGKTVLVTGAGGSIGREIFMHLFKLPVKKVIAFGHGENSIHSLIVDISQDSRFDYCIGDVRDIEKLIYEFGRYRPAIIFHAAAHKHLPLMEDYPDEAVKTNIIGTYYTSLASIQAAVRDFIFVSTDKAVNPTSVMGATKRAAEKIVLSLNKMQNVTNFRLTRFGNVLGSRGSVIPVFARQIEKGEKITVTHPDITRYFMSISEAARLVIKAATEPQGKIFVMDMGRPIRILDLAKSLLSVYGYSESNFHIEFSGLRRGEKMHEELSYSREKLKPSAFEKLFLSQEDFTPLSREEIIAMVTELAEAAEKNNRAFIYSKLGKFVQEFKYNEQEV